MKARGDSYVLPPMDARYHLFFLVFFFSLSRHPRPASSQPCHPADLAALSNFSAALDSPVPHWPLANCCSSPGVSCGVAGRVFALDLSNMSLRGPISSSLAALDQLTALNLSSNFLKGAVPPALFSLPRLARLDLSVNLLTGAIPPTIRLPAIEVFNVSYNMFNGSHHPVLRGSAALAVLDLSFNLFAGPVDPSVCASSPQLHVLRLSMNSLSGDFPPGFGNCSALKELALDFNGVSGNLPDDLFRLPALSLLYLQANELAGQLSTSVGNLSTLLELDLSLNRFSGDLPNLFTGLPKLEYFSVHSNRLVGTLPASLCNLSSLRVLNLRNNSLTGAMSSLNFTALSQLSSLDLGSNSFTGPIPNDLSRCTGLKTLNLARNSLTGEIPTSFKDLVSLSYISFSNNSLSNINSALGILQHCPLLTSLILTENFLGGESMPMDGISGFKSIEVLAIPNCNLSGSLPPWLASCAKLKVLDLSWNRLEGAIPSWLGNFDSLFYLDLSNNSLTGEIPASLAGMKGLINQSASQQHGSSMQDFPFFIKRNTTAKGLQYNQFSSLPPSLTLSNNRLVGPILPGLGNLKMVHVLDLSKNQLSGTIPEELSHMVSLETLDLSHNNLTGSIPSSLVDLNFLSSFNVAYNNLDGPIPQGRQFSTFSSDDFVGNPGLCGYNSSSCSVGVPALPQRTRRRKNKGVIIGIASGIGLGTASLLAIIYLVVSRSHSTRQEDSVKELPDANGHLDSTSSTLVLLFQNKDSAELSIGDIMKGTNNFDQANIIGCGGFGLVYRATLPDGRRVAIKRLSGDYGQMEREFQAEVETLSRAQHQNLVMLQGYCRMGNDRLLIYSYMENGSLDYWLHEKLEGGSTLDWDTRLQIARGAARGLAYLHQSCEPHILHRDIKSSNILLDENFEAHLADFGLARLILPYDTHVSTDLVGTLGYIPPEYGQASVATFKGDVYSFGVVLLELLTGKRPVNMCKPKGCRDLISWVLQMRKDKREAEVFDPFIYDKKFDRQLMQMLEIACLCLSESPKLRPLTQQLVIWLDHIGLDDELIK